MPVLGRGRRLALRLVAVVLGAVLLAGCATKGARDNNDPAGALGPDAPTSAADIYVALAGEYYARGQMDIALQRATQALDEDSDNARAQLINALIYQRLGETAKAEGFFKRAVELDPKDSTIRNAWGTFFCGQKRYAEADAQFTAALENPLYATPWIARTNAGICAKMAGDSTKARAHLDQALAGNQNFGPALLTLAEMDESQGDARSASVLLTRYFETSAPTAQALALAVRVERKRGNKKLASTYEQALKQRFPSSPEAGSL